MEFVWSAVSSTALDYCLNPKRWHTPHSKLETYKEANHLRMVSGSSLNMSDPGTM